MKLVGISYSDRPFVDSKTPNYVHRPDGQPFAYTSTDNMSDPSDQLSATAVVHATETHQPYRDYGIDETAGCIVLCRPDQHIAWIGNMDEWATLDNFFSLWVGGAK